MRTSLFLSTLFAVSMPLTLTAGAALAEKPHDAAATREPRSIELVRAHGDVVDKVYSAPVDRTERGASQQSQARQVRQPAAGARLDPAASRINCSDTGADCGAHGSGRGQASGLEASSSQTGRSARMPAFLDKILGSDRTNFNEAGEDQGMSPRAANRMWARAAGDHHGAAGTTAVAAPTQVERKEQQASSERMSCNDADECSMSLKGARKEWANASIKAGTWSGPAAEPVSNAAIRIAAQRAAEGATAPRGAQGKEGRVGGGSGADHDQ